MDKKNISANYLFVLLAFLPFLLMLLSGLVMLRFHIVETEGLQIWGLDKSQWLFYHKWLGVAALLLVIWHLLQHISWIVKLLTSKLKNRHKGANTALFIVFIATILTALLPWLLLEGTIAGEALNGIHSKLGFALVLLFAVHLKHYFKWIKNMTIYYFFNK